MLPYSTSYRAINAAGCATRPNSPDIASTVSTYGSARKTCGGLGALAGPIEVLGNQHRLLDGVGEGLGFVGIVAALLGKLTVVGTVIAAVLYGGLTVGGNAMQRHSGLPSSVILVIQALIVLLVLASDLLRSWRITVSPRRTA